ncbi:MAG TPA: hypothetical protein VKO18_00665 [Terriglobia bacterium]|nr:hypothetical protein [Terriglobia bacterium]
MESLRVTPEIHPSWFQPRTLERSFELRDGERLLGTLHFPRFGGSLAMASFAAGEWTFKRVGFLRPRVTVRRSGEEVDLAVYKPRGWGSEGELQFAGGHSYAWKPANFWATRYAFVDGAERAVVTFKPGAEESKWSDLFKFQALVEIDPSADGLEELPVMVALGWYLMILHHDDASGAAVVATMG